MSTSESGSTLRDVVRVVWRHKKKVGGFVLLTLVLAVGIILATPKSYLSQAKLFVRVGRESVTLDPTAATGQTVPVFTSREVELNSVIAMLSSRGIAEKVVSIVGAEQILSSPPGPAWVRSLRTGAETLKQQIKGIIEPSASGKSSTESQSARQFSLAVSSLMEQMSVSTPKNSMVINVACKAHSPELAQKIVDAIVQVYTEQHSRFNRTPGSEEFFRQQTNLAGQQLDAAKTQLRDMKNQLGIESIEGHRILLASKQSSIVQKQVDTAAQRASSLATAQSLKSAIASMDKEVVANRVSGRPQNATDGIRQALFELEIKERELLEKYAEDHPYVVAVRKQVQDLRHVYESEDESRSETTFSLNSNRQQLELDLMVEEARLAGLDATAGMLDEQYAAVLQQLRDFNDSAVAISDLELQLALLEKDYKTHAENLELARIDTELQRQGITNVNTIQKATLPDEPSGPSRTTLAGLSFFAAMLGGFALALLAEHLDETVKSPGDLERIGSVPVLTTLPRSRRMSVSV